MPALWRHTSDSAKHPVSLGEQKCGIEKLANYAYNRHYIQKERQSLQAVQGGTSEDSFGLSLCMIKPILWINNNNSKVLVGLGVLNVCGLLLISQVCMETGKVAVYLLFSVIINTGPLVFNPLSANIHIHPILLTDLYPEPILSPRNSIFTDQVIFSIIIFGALFPMIMEDHSICVCIHGKN